MIVILFFSLILAAMAPLYAQQALPVQPSQVTAPAIESRDQQIILNIYQEMVKIDGKIENLKAQKTALQQQLSDAQNALQQKYKVNRGLQIGVNWGAEQQAQAPPQAPPAKPEETKKPEPGPGGGQMTVNRSGQ